MVKLSLIVAGKGMEKNNKQPSRQSSTWIWLSADGVRWRINHTSDSTWSCPIGIGGKRIGMWKSGLPSSLGSWPQLKIQE